jgi:hypothetical protein
MTSEIIKQLELLKSKGVIEIKAEFEAEGTRMNELIRLKDFVSSADMPIILKIGGVEAITDMYQALDIGVECIIAPMAETPYAVSKFLDCIKMLHGRGLAEDCQFAINVETITCYNNLDEILNLPDISLLHSLTVGRVDFAGSLGEDRNFVNSAVMYDYVEDTFKKARDKGLGTAVGGSINSESIDFIAKLEAQDLIDKFETRKVVFSPKCVHQGAQLLVQAIEFEYMWLKYKRDYHAAAANEDQKRLEMLEDRLQRASEFCI